MPGSLALLNGLPKYEVFLEEAKRFPGLDASACYTYLQLLRTGDELLALDEQVLTSYGTRHGRVSRQNRRNPGHHFGLAGWLGERWVDRAAPGSRRPALDPRPSDRRRTQFSRQN